MRLLAGLYDLVLPQRCAGCGRGAAPLCARCACPLAAAPRPAWPVPAPRGLPPPWTVAPYDGAVRAVLNAFKESGRTALSAPLGAALARAVHAAHAHTAGGAGGPGGVRGGTPVVLVPVPSARGAVRRRGYDPARLIADTAVVKLRGRGLRARRVAALRHARPVADQAALGSAGRAANLAGALTAAGVRDLAVIVVDDVITTGATLAEAARALRAAGARVTAAATVAATPRRGPRQATSAGGGPPRR